MNTANGIILPFNQYTTNCFLGCFLFSFLFWADNIMRSFSQEALMRLRVCFRRLPARNTAHRWSWGEPPADRSAPGRNPPCSGTVRLLRKSRTHKWASMRQSTSQRIVILEDANELTLVLICIRFVISLHKRHEAWERKTNFTCVNYHVLPVHLWHHSAATRFETRGAPIPPFYSNNE